MAKLSKRARRAARRVAGQFASGIVRITPAPIRSRVAPFVPYADMLLGDHLIVRIGFPNRHRLSNEAWRAAQPLPHQVRRMAKLGIRTIVNLRGSSNTATYRLEKEACDRAGITLIDFRVRSRDAPSRQEVLAARELFERVDYPILLHCKSGADRAGLMSALYLHVRLGVPISEARKQLSLRYGHIRQADTGALDAFFDRYVADTATRPMAFFDWVETVYDADELRRSFKASGLANRIVNRILKRE